MGFFGCEYLPWVEGKIKEDYPSLSWELIENIVQNANITDTIERYTVGAYMKERKKEQWAAGLMKIQG